MALKNWAIDVPQKLLQSDAKPYPGTFAIVNLTVPIPSYAQWTQLTKYTKEFYR